MKEKFEVACDALLAAIVNCDDPDAACKLTEAYKNICEGYKTVAPIADLEYRLDRALEELTTLRYALARFELAEKKK
jgi:hypothetical protein